MKYFVKYLPVEGEIKEGDTFRSISGELPGSRHERLFLCSRDIQVGDKVRTGSFIDMKGWESVGGVTRDHDWITELELSQYGFGRYKDQWLTKEGLIIPYGFKVIGEVPPAATWVNEGMEFDENQIRIPEPDSPVTQLIYFKCPTCNTFH